MLPEKAKQAWDVIDRLNNIAPGNKEVRQVTEMITMFNMQGIAERMKVDEKSRITIDGKFKQTIPATEEMPVF